MRAHEGALESRTPMFPGSNSSMRLIGMLGDAAEHFTQIRLGSSPLSWQSHQAVDRRGPFAARAEP